MNISDYQKWTIETAVYPDAGKQTFNEMLYLTLGMCSEAGEFAGRIKKIVRGDKVDPVSVVSEASDVLWYLTRIASTMNISMEELAQFNYEKLSKRQKEGSIQGDDTSAGRIITANT